MIPPNATDEAPKTSGAHHVYLPRVHARTVYWAYWSNERHQWSLPYGGTPGHPAPSFDSMAKTGWLKWSEPGVMLHWIETTDDVGSDAHLARALSTGD